MHLNIKNDEAHKLATELAEITGESLTSAVTLALRERLARERRCRRTAGIAARLMKIGSQFAALADTGRSPDEILGYDARDCRHDRGRQLGRHCYLSSGG
jgi:antitoxin VapB